jgi:hypothetical protein
MQDQPSEQQKPTDEPVTDIKTPEVVLSETANSFLLKLDALLETVNRIMLIVTKSAQRARDEHNAYLDLLKERQGTQHISLTLGTPEYREYLKLLNARKKAVEAQRIVPQSFLVSMVSQYDAFLAVAIRNLFLLKPEKIRTGDKTISVGELVKFKSIEELIQELIEEEIDEVLRGSHLSQLQWMTRKFDFSFEDDDPLVQKFIEITERRNCCVHSEGALSKQYLERTKNLKAADKSEGAVGKNLPISRVYMNQVRNMLFEIGIQTVQTAWRKLRPDQNSEQDGFLTDIIFELLLREDFALARNISDFSAELRGITDETRRRIFCINRAQAYKWTGKDEEAKRIVNKLDWGASSAKFKLAVAVLNDNIEGASKLMREVPIEGPDGIDASDYRIWPLFKEARKLEVFQEAFASKFDEPLLRKDIDIPSTDTLAEPTPDDGSATDENPPTVH